MKFVSYIIYMSAVKCRGIKNLILSNSEIKIIVSVDI